MCNAYTAADHTNYHFSVNWEHLEEALDRFACFFTCPLISEDGVEREIKAVDSENVKNLTSDVWRQMQTWRTTANQQHPWSRFSSGNQQTLKIDGIHKQVNDFYQLHYSASLMNLAVHGRHSLDELQDMVVSKFSNVVDKGLEIEEFGEDLWSEEQCSKLIKVVPQKLGHVLQMHWLLPALWRFQKEAPGRYLSHLLGHEGEGSVFDLLKTLGWAQSLVAGESGLSCRSASLFMVKIELTETGQKNVDKILGIVFAYLDLLRGQDGIQEQIFDENKQLSEISFNYREKISPLGYVESLSAQMSISEPKELIRGLYGVPQVFDPELIRSILDKLTPSNVRIMWVSKDFEGKTELIEKWYQQPYSIGEIPNEWKNMWSDDPYRELTHFKSKLHLPEPNPFIPSDFTMHPKRTDFAEPKVVHESSFFKLWAKPEERFKIPKASVTLLFMSPAIGNSVKNVVLLSLMGRLINDYLNSVTYPADLAGLYFDVIAQESGFRVYVSGYNHKLLVLLKLVLDKFAKFAVEEERLSIQLEKLRKVLKNKDMEQPCSLAYASMEYLLEFHKFEYKELTEFLDSNKITSKDLTGFFNDELSKKCEVEGLVAGNITDQFVEDVVGAVESGVGKVWGDVVAPTEEEKLRFKHVKLPQRKQIVYRQNVPNPENENSAIIMLFQVPYQDDLKMNVLTELLVQIGKQHVFHELRTVEQLGYIVYMMYTAQKRVPTIGFVIQSSQYTSIYLHQRIQNFIKEFDQFLENLNDAQFLEAVKELSKSKTEKPKKLSTLFNRWYMEIFCNTLRFNRQEDEVEVLQKISKNDLIEFAKRYMIYSANSRQATVHFIGSKERAQQDQNESQLLQNVGRIDDKSDFRYKQEHFVSLR
eukprot:TRINITY_DN2417_c0_g1_i2.p1 TRINITY_DN2417_c0_g1~~TRINITY_DN2417_c0_g1_i2.p1  ORF type:complete len:971 (-),score=111.33 TRINITY_DN2417_c0_g1_i2:295-2910(-)